MDAHGALPHGSSMRGWPASAEAILEELVDGVLELDTHWRITYFNPAAVRDIVDEVRLGREAEALTETRALLDAVMHFSTSLIYAKDPEGRFTLVNRKLEELLGFTPGSSARPTTTSSRPTSPTRSARTTAWCCASAARSPPRKRPLRPSS